MRWLAEEPIASCSSADTQRIREAVAVLSHPKPRKEDVQPLQSKWQVAQQKNKKTRPLEEVLHEFQGKVIKAAQKMQQQLSDSAEQPASIMSWIQHLRVHMETDEYKKAVEISQKQAEEE